MPSSSVILFADFVPTGNYRAVQGEYLFRHYGWADLLSSLPLAVVKVFRLFRLVRVTMLLREHGATRLRGSLLRNRAGSALLSLLLLGILVLQFGEPVGSLPGTGCPDATITSAPDALWYVLVTISTVGYGDEYPVTTGGRALGSIVILIRVSIFGTPSPATSPTASSRRAPTESRMETPAGSRSSCASSWPATSRDRQARRHLRHRRRDP